MSRLHSKNSQTALDAEHDEPLLDSGSEDNGDIELANLDGGERTPISHYLHREEPPKQAVSMLWIAVALTVCVLGFTINTEATAYVEDSLGWKKPIATMYITHSSLCLPWLCHIAYLRWRNRKIPYKSWVREYNNELRASIATVEAYATQGPRMVIKRQGHTGGPLDFLATSMGIVTIVLTASGLSWFVSLSLTTPADLTAIYNCSTFFAAAFSVPLLKEKLGWLSICAVGISIVGTFTIAYGDTTAEHDDANSEFGTNRLLGNIIACVGAVAFGLYEVLFKKWACSSRPESEGSSLPLTLAASAMTGLYTAALGWIAILVLGLVGVETFSVPSLYTCLWIAIAVLAGSGMLFKYCWERQMLTFLSFNHSPSRSGDLDGSGIWKHGQRAERVLRRSSGLAGLGSQSLHGYICRWSTDIYSIRDARIRLLGREEEGEIERKDDNSTADTRPHESIVSWICLALSHLIRQKIPRCHQHLRQIINQNIPHNPNNQPIPRERKIPNPRLTTHLMKRQIIKRPQQPPPRRPNINPIILRSPNPPFTIYMNPIRNSRPHQSKQPPINRLPPLIQIKLINRVGLCRIRGLGGEIRGRGVGYIEGSTIWGDANSVGCYDFVRGDYGEEDLFFEIEAPDCGGVALTGEGRADDVLD
jgi:drug/metabolite transporter (DMT)-like permease